MLNPLDVFTSEDKFERLTRAEVVEILNTGLAEQQGTLGVEAFDEGDDRLTDEVCYYVANEWSNNGDPVETTQNTLAEHPELIVRG